MIAITGASGFLGRAVGRALRKAGITIYPIPRGAIELPFHCPILLHLAGENKRLALMEEANIELTRRMLHLAATNRVSCFIYLSSVAVTHYEQGRNISLYARTKAMAEDLVLDSSLEVHILRPGTVFGGYGWRSWPVQAMKSLLKGEAVSEMMPLQSLVSEIIGIAVCCLNASTQRRT